MNFTTEQVEFLKDVYNIDVSEKMYKIKDGYVCEHSSFYWLSKEGPEEVNKQNFENTYAILFTTQNVTKFYTLNLK